MLWIRFAGLTAGGHNGDVVITDFSGISNDLRLNRTDRLGTDGQLPGHDYVSKRVWTLTLTTLADDENGAVALASQWEKALLDPAVMRSTKLVPLDYSRDGQTWFRVFGRPADYAGPNLDDLTQGGAGSIDLQFEQLNAWHYSMPHSVALTATASAFAGGWATPFVFPLVASGTSVPSAVSVENAGDAPAPVQVTFYGPSLNPRAWAGPLSVEYRGALAWDEWVTIDGLSHEVLLGGAGRDEPVHVPGRLSPHTLISELTVPAGRTEWWYEAIDESGQSRAVFTWHDTYRTMQ